MLDLSIIIVNYNNANYLSDCLSSIYKQTHKISHEIIFVDNNSTDNSLELVKTKYPKVRVIVNRENLGFCKANNQGLKIYQGRYALLLNTDTIVKDGAFDQLVEFMDSHDQAGACGPKLLNPDGSTQHQGGLLAKKFWRSDVPVKVDTIIGACLMVRREVIDQVGGLDENFFFGNDDLDWCRRIRKAGWAVFFVPQAAVMHYGGFTIKLFNQKIFVEGFRGGLYFAKKHYGNLVYEIYRLLLAPAMLLAALFSLLFYPFLNNKQKLGAYFQIFLICLKGQLTPSFPLSFKERGRVNFDLTGGELKHLLFLSNGHGEDLVADKIIEHLGKNFEVIRLPLVNRTLPSGGFSLRNWRFLARDLGAGLLGSTYRNIRTLMNLRGKVDLTVAIGDIVPILGALVVKAPFIFVGVNKSDYYKTFGYSYTPWEKWLLKRYAKKVYARDELTARNLQKENISAEYVGNPLMDCIDQIRNTKSEIRNKSEFSNIKTIGFLPGTREDAKLNIEDFEKIVALLPKEYKFLIATTLSNIPSPFEQKAFADVLAESDLIIGLSGTGNEQAAGSGLPVVSFYGRGSQYNKKFAEAQKELLGDSLELVRSKDRQTIATAVKRLIGDHAKMKKMAAAGQQRMGERGAAARIAALAASAILP